MPVPLQRLTLPQEKALPTKHQDVSALIPDMPSWVWSADRYRSSDRAKIKYALILTGKLLFPKRGLNTDGSAHTHHCHENVINIDSSLPFAINSLCIEKIPEA